MALFGVTLFLKTTARWCVLQYVGGDSKSCHYGLVEFLSLTRNAHAQVMPRAIVKLTVTNDISKHWSGTFRQKKVSWLVRCPDFRGWIVHKYGIWDLKRCPVFEVSSFQISWLEGFHSTPGKLSATNKAWVCTYTLAEIWTWISCLVLMHSATKQLEVVVAVHTQLARDNQRRRVLTFGSDYYSPKLNTLNTHRLSYLVGMVMCL